MIEAEPGLNLYSQKAPQQVLYFILRKMLDEFSFEELPCQPKKIIT